MASKELNSIVFNGEGNWENRGGVFLASSVPKIEDKGTFVKDNDHKI
jgi:hypothetical protein